MNKKERIGWWCEICQRRKRERERDSVPTTVIHHNPRYQIYQNSLIHTDPNRLPSLISDQMCIYIYILYICIERDGRDGKMET